MLIVKEKNYLIAKSDIITYKTMYAVPHYDVNFNEDGIVLHCTSTNSRYRIGWAKWSLMLRKPKPVYFNEFGSYKIDSVGIRSYGSYDSAMDMAHQIKLYNESSKHTPLSQEIVIAACTIPKGSKYYYGTDCSFGLNVMALLSNKLVVNYYTCMGGQ